MLYVARVCSFFIFSICPAVFAGAASSVVITLGYCIGPGLVNITLLCGSVILCYFAVVEFVFHYLVVVSFNSF